MSTVFQVWNGIKRFRLLDSSRSRMMYKPILPTLFFFFLVRGNFILPENVFCGSRWGSKILAVPSSYKKCTSWLELETYYTDLKFFTITLRLLKTILPTLPCDWMQGQLIGDGLTFQFPGPGPTHPPTWRSWLKPLSSLNTVENYGQSNSNSLQQRSTINI
jgi:hypothetical protein